eukprot:4677512-Karenia_brevis.AAC.1
MHSKTAESLQARGHCGSAPILIMTLVHALCLRCGSAAKRSSRSRWVWKCVALAMPAPLCHPKATCRLEASHEILCICHASDGASMAPSCTARLAFSWRCNPNTGSFAACRAWAQTRGSASKY